MGAKPEEDDESEEIVFQEKKSMCATVFCGILVITILAALVCVLYYKPNARKATTGNYLASRTYVSKVARMEIVSFFDEIKSCVVFFLKMSLLFVGWILFSKYAKR